MWRCATTLPMGTGRRRLYRSMMYRRYATIPHRAWFTFQPPFHLTRSDLFFTRSPLLSNDSTSSPHRSEPSLFSQHAVLLDSTALDRPVLHLAAPDASTPIAMPLRPEQTIAQLMSLLTEELASWHVKPLHFEQAGEGGPKRWARDTLLIDLLRALYEPNTTLYLVCRGTDSAELIKYHLTPPSVSARLAPLEEEWRSVKARFERLAPIKKQCDAKAARLARSLGLVGLTLLCAQWSFMFRLTYFE